MRENYVCPMHPEITSDKPGRCSICGMALEKVSHGGDHGVTPAKSAAGHGLDKHAGHSLEMFMKKFWLSLALTLPVVFVSEVVQKFFGFSVGKNISEIISLVLGSAVFFYGGTVFIKGAVSEIRARLPGMMTLIALAISAAYVFSVFAVLLESGSPLFWELVTLITIMLLGHWLEMKSVQGVQDALGELAKLIPDKAEKILPNGKTEIVSLSELKINDVLLIRPGSKIPADAKVIRGESEVDESLVTGESRPVKKTLGSEVIAGTVNGDGSLEVKVSRLGEQTFLAGVMKLVAEAQTSKSKLQVLSDKAAFVLTIVALAVGSLSFGLWLLAKASFSFAVERLVSVLVIACPHALGLAVPLVASISTTKAAKNGFLVKQRLALESARNIDIVLFDKTGTLTKGEFGVTRISSFDDSMSNDEILRLAASADNHSEHPIAKAIVKKALDSGLKLSEVKNFKRLAGKGVSALIRGKQVFVGSEAVLAQVGVKNPVKTKEKTAETKIYVVQDSRLVGTIGLADLVREESKQAIQELKSMGIKTAMITGDAEDVALVVAAVLGLDEFFARVLPEQKSSKVKELQSRGLKVAMVGDGINDAPALTQADLGVAIGAGTNVAIESAGIILVKDNPLDVVKVIKLSRLTYKKMMENLFWATGYNVLAMPLAAGVLAFKGILLQPAVAAVFMSLSTVIVAFNALLLKRAKL